MDDGEISPVGRKQQAMRHRTDLHPSEPFASLLLLQCNPTLHGPSATLPSLPVCIVFPES